MKTTMKTKVKEIIRNYFVFKKICKRLSNNTNVMRTDAYRYYRDVEISFYSLSAQQQFIFHNEFLDFKSSFWWQPYFSKKEYRNLENITCHNFLKKFYEIH